MTARIEQLFNKFIDGSCSQQEFSELMDLLRKNDQEEKVRHILYEVYQHTARSRKSVSYVDEFGELHSAVEEVEESVPVRVVAKRARLPYRRIAVIIAAAAFLTAAGSLFLDHYRTAGPSMEMPLARTEHKVTHRAEMKQLLLPDSTQVWLNAASTLDYPIKFAADKREVYLNGEAYFEVKQVPQKPFLVHTGKLITRTDSAAFNIKAYYGQPDIRVAVKTGNVQWWKNSRQWSAPIGGQQAVWTNGASQAVVSPASPKTVGQWKRGILHYENWPITNILNDLERQYNIIIEVRDESLQSILRTITFRKSVGAQAALERIATMTHRLVSFDNGTYYFDRP